MTKPTDLVQGTLDLLIMRTLASGHLHGWAIAQRIQQLSNDVLQVNQGSLYPALQRLERQGWIAAEWGTSKTNRRARFYRLSNAGEQRLEQERADWERLSSAISLVMRTA
jgi:transcriptional regulator